MLKVLIGKFYLKFSKNAWNVETERSQWVKFKFYTLHFWWMNRSTNIATPASFKGLLVKLNSTRWDFMSIVRIELQPCWLISFELKSNFCMTFKEPSSKNPAATSLTPLSPIPHPCKFRMIRNCDCYITCDKPRHPCIRVFFFCEAPILDPS